MDSKLSVVSYQFLHLGDIFIGDSRNRASGSNIIVQADVTQTESPVPLVNTCFGWTVFSKNIKHFSDALHSVYSTFIVVKHYGSKIPIIQIFH